MRLDKAVFEKHLAQSRSRAELLIADGGVRVNGTVITKASHSVGEADEITVTDTIGYVGRGGIKLEEALKVFGVSPKGCECLDIGASTGGFTQCLLNNGAESVCAVDVGHGQLSEILRNDERVKVFENTNAKFLTPEMLGGKKDICVMDVSFISQTFLYGVIFNCLNENGTAVTLVKPQFEAGRGFADKRGIIKDKKVFYSVFEVIERSLTLNGFVLENICRSPITGGDGNTEFLIKFSKFGTKCDYNEILKGLIH